MSEFSERRIKAYHQVIKNFPDGLTKDNIPEFKSQMKKEEKRLKILEVSDER